MEYDDEAIIFNEIPLTEVFIPARLLRREGRLKELERCLKACFTQQACRERFPSRFTGTGRTTLAKRVLESHFKDISVYVNCWKYRSTHDVLSEILRGLGFIVHGREYMNELITRLEI